MSFSGNAGRRPHFPLTASAIIMVAVATSFVYSHWSGLAVDVGHQASPQEVFFGTEFRNPDVARFTIPIEFIVATFFVLIALMFVGLGQTLGRAFDAYPNRVVGYTLNIGGSLLGIIGFSALSFLQAPPLVWFAITCAGIAYLLYQTGGLTAVRVAALIAITGAVTAPDAIRQGNAEVRWSPYYAVERSGGGGVEGDAGEGSAVGEIVVGGEADGAVEGEDDARGGGDGADPVEGVGEVVVAACAVPGEGGCGVGRISEEEGCDGSYGEGEPFCRPFRLTIARATHFPLVLSAT